LHRALDVSEPVQYFTIAVWESREAFAAATSTDWWRSYVSEFGFSAEPTGLPPPRQFARSSGAGVRSTEDAARQPS
jgi:hypothetical protein